MEKLIYRLIDRARAKVESEMIPLETLSAEDLAIDMMAYCRFIEHRYMQWLASCLAGCATEECAQELLRLIDSEGRSCRAAQVAAMADELERRFDDDRSIQLPSLLGGPTQFLEVASLLDYVMRDYSLFRLHFVAAFVNCYRVTIPWLDAAADRLGVEERIYLNQFDEEMIGGLTTTFVRLAAIETDFLGQKIRARDLRGRLENFVSVHSAANTWGYILNSHVAQAEPTTNNHAEAINDLKPPSGPWIPVLETTHRNPYMPQRNLPYRRPPIFRPPYLH